MDHKNDRYYRKSRSRDRNDRLEKYNPIKVGFKDGRGIACRDRALERA